MTDPADLLGVYRSLDDVPERHRLRHHADAFEGRDVAGEFMEAEVLPEMESELSAEKARRQADRWRAFMGDRARHHALARPGDVEEYAAGLGEFADLTAVQYFSRLKALYDWLTWTPRFPHAYDPVLMAAHAGGEARRIWDLRWGR